MQRDIGHLGEISLTDNTLTKEGSHTGVVNDAKKVDRLGNR
jgi:hypothetical protein